MAQRIKGITIEIGGDTTGLNTALKGINAEIKDTEGQLRDINRLLKLDPGNTELLAQKQRALGDAIQMTEEKLIALKTASTQANEALAAGKITQAQYDGLQREIIETEEKYKSLIGTMKETDHQTAEYADKMGVLESEMKLLESRYTGAEKSSKQYRAENKLLNQEIKAQKDHVKELREGLKNAQDEYGKNDARTLEWKKSLNEAKAELNNTKTALKQNKEAMKEHADATEKDAEKAERARENWEKFGNVLATVGKAFAGAVAVGGAAAVALSKEVIDSYGELEQNLGGAEAVFGKYAQSLESTSEEAYKKMGTSQSEYLATANKMGALFQGSGLDQQRSLELTTQAMQRAADMASVMGIDTEAALEAVTGAAKGNYTMMDNLGVAMNATTLEAYAVSQGMKTAWKDMSNAEKAELAMKYFFENTTQYAGNFEREATQTISGAFGLMSAATESFVAGLGNSNADISVLAQNIIDAFMAVKDNVVPVLQNIIDVLPEVGAMAIQAVRDLIPEFLPVFSELTGQIITLLLSLLPDIIGIASYLLDAVFDSLVSAAPDLGDTISALINNGIITTISDLAPKLIEAGIAVISSILDGMSESLWLLTENAAYTVEEIAETFISGLPLLMDSGIRFIGELISGMIWAITDTLFRLGDIIDAITGYFTDNEKTFIDTGVEVLTALISDMPRIIQEILKETPRIVKSITDLLVQLTPQIIQAGVMLFVSLVNNLPLAINEICAQMPSIINAVIDMLITLTPLIVSEGIELFTALLTSLPVIVSELLRGVSEIVISLVKGFKDRISDFKSVGADIVSGVWNGILNSWNKFKQNVVDKFSSLVKSVKKSLGIASPSKLFRDEVGEMMGKGVEIGFVDSIKDAANTVREMLPQSFDFGAMQRNPALALAGAGANSTMTHSGVIRVEGVNSAGQTQDVVRIVVDQLRKDRRL